MWQKSENSESRRPADIENTGRGVVIVRRNFHLIPADEERPEHWSYEEWQMTYDQYDVYRAMTAETADLSDALIEIADLLSEVING